MPLPAPGYRYPYYGTVYYVGRSGYSWSSSTAGNNSYFLDFGCDWIFPNYNNLRAIGLQLRCLQE
ncbi:MAG: hypothetical protein K2G93_00520 [Rikenella sp.]|nr:hypothetical protein [Rikenella sp.]